MSRPAGAAGPEVGRSASSQRLGSGVLFTATGVGRACGQLVTGSGRQNAVRGRRQTEQFEFRPPTTGAVLDRMRFLAETGDGWINLLPGVPDEEVEASPRGVFSALFGTAQAPVSMCTWMPTGAGRGAARGQSVGILHPRGRYAVAQLGELGVPVPPGWRTRQDHARRGLILHPPSGSDLADVLDWMLRAGAALAVVPLTGAWQARVYLPLAGSAAGLPR